MKKILAAMCLCSVLIAGVARGEAVSPPLGDRVPGDAIIYAGWAGSDALTASYAPSHLKRVMDASEMPKLFTEFMPQLVRRVARDNQEAAEVLKQVVAIGGPLWHHPTAIYFGGIDWNGPQPSPKLAVLCDAGDDTTALAERITKLLEQAPNQQGPVPIVKTYGSLVVLAFGTPAAVDADFAQPAAVSISKSTKFKSALDQVQANPAFVEYIDFDAAVKLADDTVVRINDAHTTERWQKAREVLGLEGLHTGIATTGFDGADWSEQGYVSTSAGDRGILALLHPTPLSKELLNAIPQSADRVLAGKIDLDAVLGEIRSVVGEFDQASADQWDEAFSNVNQAAGLDIRKDFLATLGDEWAMYTDRTVAGPGLLGSVVINRLKDATTFEKSLNQLSQRANNILKDVIKEPGMKVEFRESTVNGTKLHFLAVPLVTPCWAMKDGNLYLGLYPQVVSAAVDQVSNHSPSILNRPEFIALMKRLGDHDPAGLQFSNLPVTAPDGYTDMLALSRLYLGIADIFGVHPPTMVVPPLSKILPELSPSGAVSWCDAAGMHTKTLSPFPGSDLMAGSGVGGGVMMDSMLVSIMLPSLNKARETANRAKCASNEHQIGLALLLYSNDNQGKLPDDLGTLVKTEQIAASVFVCPSGNTQVPGNIATMTPDEQVKWVNDNSDYVYLGKGLNENKIEATRIVVYEKESAHENEGMNLLFGDGHAEWQPMAAAQEMLRKQAGN